MTESERQATEIQPGGAAQGLLIVLAYLGPFALIPFLLTDDRELRWHGLHGLVLFGTEVLVWAGLLFLFGRLEGLDFGCSGCIFHVFYCLALMVVHIVCIVRGLDNRRTQIPLVTSLTDRLVS